MAVVLKAANVFVCGGDEKVSLVCWTADEEDVLVGDKVLETEIPMAFIGTVEELDCVCTELEGLLKIA